MYRYNTTTDRIGRPGIGAGPRLGFPLSVVSILLEFVAVWQDRRHQRHALARLDDRMLHDIGLTAADVEAEISKPFWR
ncbi:MAG TPA: DUF1127 domain-containing protein [Candidatus Cybelea sp.]|nr:DUF1127 domain-containing protein [Candidatus Cybelea sp.]